MVSPLGTRAGNSVMVAFAAQVKGLAVIFEKSALITGFQKKPILPPPPPGDPQFQPVDVDKPAQLIFTATIKHDGTQDLSKLKLVIQGAAHATLSDVTRDGNSLKFKLLGTKPTAVANKKPVHEAYVTATYNNSPDFNGDSIGKGCNRSPANARSHKTTRISGDFLLLLLQKAARNPVSDSGPIPKI